MKLKKELGWFGVFCISSGTMLSSGLFVLPGLAYAEAGPGVIAAYFLAGLFAVAGLLSQAELATAMPKSGGAYFYVMRSLGPAVGTSYGLITVLALVLKSAFALVGLGILIQLVFRAHHIFIDTRIITSLLCLFFLGVNVLGVRDVIRLQMALVLGIFAVLLFYIAYGLPAIEVQRFEPFAPLGMAGILSTAGFVFVSYGGPLKVASIAGEVKNPGRSLPLGMVLSLLSVLIIHVLVIFITTGVLDPASLSQSLTPISDGAAVFLGKTGWLVLSLAAVLAFASAANAGIMAASRYPLALSGDQLLPEFLGRINSKFHTPHYSLALVGVVMVLSLFLEVQILVKMASSVLILTFIISCLAVIILRESRLQNYQPSFRAPLYPWVQIIGTLGYCFFLAEMGWQALAACVAFILIGLFVYWFYGRIRTTREFALLHLIERITAKELTSHSLESELKEIVRERDDIMKDRFDHVIEDSVVLDLDRAVTMEELFRLAAETLSTRVKRSPEELYQLLIEREKDSSTVLNPFLAIPHVIIEGEKVVDILLVRCRSGIAFPESSSEVHTVFVLIGTRDERPFHLRALAAICQIVQDPHFEKKWMRAKSEEVLRDIVLLGKRRRHP